MKRIISAIFSLLVIFSLIYTNIRYSEEVKEENNKLVRAVEKIFREKNIKPFNLNLGKDNFTEVKNKLTKQFFIKGIEPMNLFYVKLNNKDYLYITDKEHPIYTYAPVRDGEAFSFNFDISKNWKLPDYVLTAFYKGKLFWVTLVYNINPFALQLYELSGRENENSARALYAIQEIFSQLVQKYGNPDTKKETKGTVTSAVWYYDPYVIEYSVEQKGFLIQVKVDYQETFLFSEAIKDGKSNLKVETSIPF